jgi:UDP-N-acetylmuramoylalanine--D-glutamate ligase
MLKELKNKRILILGFGREGQDTFLFLRKVFPKKILGIADRNEKVKSQKPKAKNVKWYSGRGYLKSLKNYDVIVKSPGVPIHSPEVEKAFRQGKITSQTEIFLENCPGKIVGITGTKGKSTTASLIYQILREGLRAHPIKFASQTFNRVNLVGNIGKPVLNLLFRATPKDIYVYELSSHQLYNLKKSPHIAVLLNLFAEHLDYYKNFKEYAKAKAIITKYQTKNDYLVYNSGDKIVREIARKSTLRQSQDKKPKKIPIKGKYYELDRNAAKAVGKIFKIPLRIIQKAIKKFKPLPHRLELVGKFRGITFYNDALSTIPETAIAAIDALGANVQTIMLGGYDRKIKFENLAKRVFKSKIKNVILFPTTGEKIWKAIRQAQDKALRQKHLAVSRIEPFFVNNMPEAVKLAYKYTQKGKICLLSTASTSFSIFRDYREKGNLFKKYVRQLGKK